MDKNYKKPSRDFVVIDVEYAAFPEQSICQFGLAVVRDAKIVKTQRWNIQPCENRYDDQTIAVHGMTPETTKNCPTLPQVWPEIAEYLDGQELWAHNAASVEVPVLEKNLTTYGIPHKPIQIFDSMRLYIRPDKKYWNDGIGLENCLYALGLPCENHHDAAEDSAMCAQIIIATINKQKPDWKLSDEMMERANEIRRKLKEEARAVRQAKQLDLFADALCSTSLDCDIPKRHAPTIFEKEFSEAEDGIDEVDFNKLNTSNRNPLFGCNVVITGFFHIARRQILKALDAMEAKRSNNITKKTQVVLIGERNAGPKKLADLTTLIHNGYNIARITGDEQLDHVLYDVTLTAKDFAIPEPAKKELNFTVSHFRKHKHSLVFPVNSIAGAELYFPNSFAGNAPLFYQICGNLGAFGNWELNPQVTHVVLPLSTVTGLQQNEKDKVIREYEEWYNKSRAVTFSAQFVTQHDILKFARERIVQHGDDVTENLYIAYLESLGIDPENDFKYGLAVARRNFEKNR
ncbi:MAG: hypothetical protein IJ559_05910 [Prevotella sp.]|nr:hypothetical protein [Prevotella sp.]